MKPGEADKMVNEGAIYGDADSWLNSIRFIPSPNCDERPPGCSVSLLVIHSISLPPGEFGGNGVIELFTNRLDHDEHPYYRNLRDLKVSAHFFIRRTEKPFNSYRAKNGPGMQGSPPGRAGTAATTIPSG